ncbi:indigoidine synthase A-like protein [Agrocybe pediades]|nr:indigoidine synthase A-like protein [Agrocybe pediades]
MSLYRGVGLRNCKPFVRSLSTPSSFLNKLGRLAGAPVDLHPEVEDALAHSNPVVALETAIVTHGLPFPASLQVPLGLEEVVRSAGAIPATIGMISGRIKVGLEKTELERLAQRERKPAKISRRDIAAASALKADGGTTCSATLIFAAYAGIKVFATGGLGGVHRGAENSLDISADLHELTRCPVGLVSSGVKSILDIKRTLEYLETLGVPVISYGESREFPAFFSRHSGHSVPWNVEDPMTAAKLLYTQEQLKMRNGALFAVPIPEEYEPIGKEVQNYVNQAVEESERNGISKSGNDATPWLLSRVAELSAGKSLKCNIALIRNTALVGGQIAVNYQKLLVEESGQLASSLNQPSLTAKDSHQGFPDHSEPEISSKDLPPANVVVIGSAAVDITAQESSDTNSALARHSTAPGTVNVSLGGVGRNIAEATHRVMEAKYTNLSSVLVSLVGKDAFGHILEDKLKMSGMRTDGIVKIDHQTAVCNMVLDSNGSLVGGVADMTIVDALTGELITSHLSKHKPSIVALDGNLSTSAITDAVQYCRKNGIQILFEPTSAIKSTAILPAITTVFGDKDSDVPVAYCTPNLLELTQLYEAVQSDLASHPSCWDTIDQFNLGSAFRIELEQLARQSSTDHPQSTKNLAFLIEEGIAQQAINLLPFFQHLIIKCGDQGVLVAMYISSKDAATSGWAKLRSNPKEKYLVAHGKSNEIVVLQHFPSLHVEKLANVTGAGDSFVGALLATLAHSPNALYDPKRLHEVVRLAQKAAVLTLQSHSAVSPELSRIE